MNFSRFGKVRLPKNIENGAFNGQAVSDLEKEVFATPPMLKPHFRRRGPSKNRSGKLPGGVLQTDAHQNQFFGQRTPPKRRRMTPETPTKSVIWGGRFPRESVQNRLGRIFAPKVSPWSSMFSFEQLLAPFWNHFGATCGVLLDVSFGKTNVI